MMTPPEIQQPFHVIIDNKENFKDYLPLIISAIAAFLSFIALRRSKKAVEPFLSMNASNDHLGNKFVKSHYVIKNSGLGPARILSCNFHYKGDIYSSFSELLINGRSDYFDKASDDSIWMYELSETVLSPMEELELFNCKFNIPFPDSKKYLEFLAEVELYIEYRSLHGKKKEFQRFLNQTPT
jgi:hypothetical protein